MRKTLIYFPIMACFFICCNLKDKKETNRFYNYSRINYIYRLPIIEPYEITSPDNGASWSIAFKNFPPPTHGVQFLTKIGVKDSVFIVYSPRDLSFSSDHPEVWVVVNTRKDERVFTTENEYKRYLLTQGINEIKLYDINTVFREFEEKVILPPEWPEQPSENEKRN